MRYYKLHATYSHLSIVIHYMSAIIFPKPQFLSLMFFKKETLSFVILKTAHICHSDQINHHFVVTLPNKQNFHLTNLVISF